MYAHHFDDEDELILVRVLAIDLSARRNVRAALHVRKERRLGGYGHRLDNGEAHRLDNGEAQQPARTEEEDHVQCVDPWRHCVAQCDDRTCPAGGPGRAPP